MSPRGYTPCRVPCALQYHVCSTKRLITPPPLSLSCKVQAAAAAAADGRAAPPEPSFYGWTTHTLGRRVPPPPPPAWRVSWYLVCLAARPHAHARSSAAAAALKYKIQGHFRVHSPLLLVRRRRRHCAWAPPPRLLSSSSFNLECNGRFGLDGTNTSEWDDASAESLLLPPLSVEEGRPFKIGSTF